MIPRKAELKRQGSREARNFRRRFRIPYEFFLGACEAGKATKEVLIGCNGRGGEAEHSILYLWS